MLLSAVLLGALTPGYASAASINEFSKGLHADSDLGGITPGPDGNLWFTDGGSIHAVSRITPSGKITEFTAGLNGPGRPADITAGPDGNLWFTETGSAANAIGRITPEGTITEFPLTPGSAPSSIIAGPDHSLWFLDAGTTPAIGRISTSGTITEFTAGLNGASQPNDLAVGPDGNLWFTDQGSTTKAIGRVTPDGTITEFSDGLGQLSSLPDQLTGGADGNVWFTDPNADAIGRITPKGTITEFKNGLPSGSQPDSLTAAPDGNIWFVDQLSGHRAIGRVKPNGTITEFSKGLDPTSLQDDITVGADGNLWIEQSMPGGIARITTSGEITQFRTGLNLGAGNDGDQIVSGPDGNLWFTDNGYAKAIGKVALQLAPRAKTGPASGISDSSATLNASINPLGAATQTKFEYGSSRSLGRSVESRPLAASGTASHVTGAVRGLSPATTFFYRVVATNVFAATMGQVRSFKTSGRLTTAKIGDQKAALATPSLSPCLKGGKRLAIRLTSARRSGHHLAKLRFLSAAFYIDRGVRHGRRRSANRVVHHLPAALTLKLAGLRSGSHRLKVVVSYREQIGKHKTAAVTKTLKTTFRVC